MAGAPQINGNAGDIIAILDACLIDGFGTATPDGNKITVSGGVATVEFSGGHNFEQYAVIEIAGATPTALNDVWRITGTTATTFTFDCPEIPDGTATGSISVKRPAPGHWQKSYGDNLKAAYQSTHPDSSGFFLRVDNTGSGTSGVEVKGYTGMTDIDTGSQPFPATGSLYWRMVKSTSYDPRPWALIADEAFIHFFVRWEYDRNQDRGCAFYSFGDLAAADFYASIITGQTTASAGYSYSDTGAFTLDDPTGCFFAGERSEYTAENVDFFRNGVGDTTHPTPLAGVLSYRTLSANPLGQIPSKLDMTGPVLGRDSAEIRGIVPGLNECFFGEEVVNQNGIAENQFSIFSDESGAAYLLIKVGVVGNSTYRSVVLGISIMEPWR